MHLMQFTVTVSGISMYNQTKKKNEKGMQNIYRHKLKQFDLEYSRNFSSIFKQSIQKILPISSKLSIMIDSEVVLFLTLT